MSHSPSNHPGRIFGVLGILFLIIGAFLWYRHYYRSTLVQAQQSNYTDYVVTTTPGWIDTGVWVGPYSVVGAWSSDIFTLAVDSTTDEASLTTLRDFRAGVITAPYFTRYADTAKVENQGKIYIYSDKPLQVRFTIHPMPKVEREKLDAEKAKEDAEHPPPSYGFKVFGVVCFGTVLLILMAMFFALYKKVPK